MSAEDPHTPKRAPGYFDGSDDEISPTPPTRRRRSSTLSSHRSESQVPSHPGSPLNHPVPDPRPTQADCSNPDENKSAPPTSGHDSFKALLLGYSKAVMYSTINDAPQQAEMLEEAITSARDKVVEFHSNTIEDLKKYIAIDKAQSSQMQDRNAKQGQELLAVDKLWEDEKRTVVDLKKNLVEARCEKERYKRAWEGDEGIRTEYREMKEDRRRRKDNAVKIWEKAEKVKLEL